MRRARIVILFLSLLLASGARAGEEVADTFRVIDISRGLPENRTRAVRQLSDGRIAVVTAGTLSIYDFSGFSTLTPSSSRYFSIGAVDSYRKVYVDGADRVWTKFKGALWAYGARANSEVNVDSLFASFGIGQKINNFFADASGNYCFIGVGGDLMLYDESDGLRTAGNVNDIDKSGLRAVHLSGGRIALCYAGGRLAVIDAATGARVFNGRGVDRKYAGFLSDDLLTAVADGDLVVAANFRKERKSALFRFDMVGNTLKFSKTLPMKVSSLTSDADGRVTVGSGNELVTLSEKGEIMEKKQILASGANGISPMESEIMDMLKDKFGGSWIATLGMGLLYLDSERASAVATLPEAYPYEKNSIFCSERARRVGESVQPRLTGSSLEDREGRLWLASVGGLKIFDENDVLIADLNRSAGLPADNVYGLCADGNGDIWVSHPAQLSRVRIEADTIRITPFNDLDGIRLDGAEFGQRMISADSIGRICVGFSGGICVVDPASVGNDRYSRAVPLNDFMAGKDVSGRVWLLFAVCCAVLICIVSWLLLARRRRQQSCTQVQEVLTSEAEVGEMVSEVPVEEDDMPSDEDDEKERNRERIMQVGDVDMPNPDTEFLDRLRTVVEANIGDPDFSVRKLSGLMLMERSGLYRKMQALTGITPSEYIKDVQLTLAANLLRSGAALSISEVAEKVGFSDPKYFSKVFKSRYGISPKEYTDTRGCPGENC